MMKIALDYDGTTADTNACKAVWIRETLGISLAAWQCDRTDCVPIIGRENYERMADVVYDREWTIKAAPVEGALQAVRLLASEFELHLVTARPARRIEYAREWLDKEKLLDCFHGFHSSQGVPKEQICRSIGAVILVDDDRRHVEKLTGLIGIHLTADVNRQAGDDGLYTCRNWEDAVSVIRRLVSGGRVPMEI